jgi:hypothetical protein
MQILPDPTIGTNIVSFAFLLPENSISVSPHRMNGTVVQSKMMDTGYYIRSR